MDKVQLSLVDEGIDTEGSHDVQKGLRVAADWEIKDRFQYFVVDSPDHNQLSSGDVTQNRKGGQVNSMPCTDGGLWQDEDSQTELQWHSG